MSLPAQSVIQQTMVMQHGTEKTANVIHWENEDELSEAALSLDIQDLVTEIYDAYKLFVHEDVDFLGSIFSAPLIPSFGSRTIFQTGAGGDLSGDAGQSTNYFIIRKYAALDLKTSRGRFLACGFPEQSTHVNQMTSTLVVLAVTLATALHTPFAATSTIWQPVIYSRKLETYKNVFKTTIDPICRSFHGRQSKTTL